MNKMRLIILIITLSIFYSCNENTSKVTEQTPCNNIIPVTFLELGSDNCIPCKNMRPVMDSIQKKYGGQVIVKFIDVIKNSKEAAPFKIRVMPTQVFLDSCSNEIHRHEGFYHEDSIHKFLQSKGLKLISE